MKKHRGQETTTEHSRRETVTVNLGSYGGTTIDLVYRIDVSLWKISSGCRSGGGGGHSGSESKSADNGLPHAGKGSAYNSGAGFLSIVPERVHLGDGSSIALTDDE